MAPGLFLTYRLVRAQDLCSLCRTLLTNAVAQSLGRRDPKVVALEVDAENIVVCRGSLYGNFFHDSRRVAHEHFRLVGIERRTIDRPVRAVEVGEAFVGGEPRAIGVDGFDLIEKVAGEAAVFLQEIVPVAAVVAAGGGVSRGPQKLVPVAGGGGGLGGE